MVKKYILNISDEPNRECFEIAELLKNNHYLHEILIKYKNKITEHYRNKLWDKYKKLTNEYEMIFTTPNTNLNICTYLPVSRSFFKMWEMLHDFKDCFFNSQKKHKLNVMFLAEGPGGFAEAFIKFREKQDQYYGISLKSINKNIPEWKYIHNMEVIYGKDGTGDLYNVENINYIRDHYPRMDFITADGGFDFSSDFNSQEDLSLRLILCEIYAALTIQNSNGHFILKIYDIFQSNTLKLISLLKLFYQNIYIVKPLSSRPANSEKYLVCTHFSYSHPTLINQLQHVLQDYDEEKLNLFFETIDHKPNVLHNVVCYNVYYTLRQVYYIEQTIKYIMEFGKNFHNETIKQKIAQITEHHKQKAIKWCKKYGLQHC